MCYKKQCKSCNKPTWGGCGQHISFVLSDVKEKDRCPGWETGRCPHYFEKLRSDEKKRLGNVDNDDENSNDNATKTGAVETFCTVS